MKLAPNLPRYHAALMQAGGAAVVNLVRCPRPNEDANWKHLITRYNTY